jgi:hypothetical protein
VKTERSFGEEPVVKARKDYYLVRCADKTTADRVKSSAISTVIYLDGDGKEFLRKGVSAETLEAAFQEANQKYSKKEISWPTGEAKEVISQAKLEKKLVALAFTDEGKDSQVFLENLQDRWVAKYHDRLTFLKLPFDRNSETCKEWGVTGSPTLVLVNPQEEDAKKRVIDRLTSKRELVSIHAFLAKNLDRLESQSSPRR